MTDGFEASLQDGTEGEVALLPLALFSVVVVPEIQRKLSVNERSGPHQLVHVQEIVSKALFDSEGTTPSSLIGELFPWIASPCAGSSATKDRAFDVTTGANVSCTLQGSFVEKTLSENSPGLPSPVTA